MVINQATVRISGIVSALIILVSAFLPWATVTVPFLGNVSIAGTETAGRTTLALGLLSFPLLVWLFTASGQTRAKGINIALLVIGAAVIATAVFKIIDITLASSDAEGFISVGIGLYATFIGGLGLTGCAAFTVMQARKEQPVLEGRDVRGIKIFSNRNALLAVGCLVVLSIILVLYGALNGSDTNTPADDIESSDSTSPSSGDYTFPRYGSIDESVKDNVGMIGPRPTDGEIRRACQALRNVGWEYMSLGMGTDMRSMTIAASLTTFASGEELVGYCNSK